MISERNSPEPAGRWPSQAPPKGLCLASRVGNACKPVSETFWNGPPSSRDFPWVIRGRKSIAEEPANCRSDARAGTSVAIRVVRARHGFVRLLVIEEPAAFRNDALPAGAN